MGYPVGDPDRLCHTCRRMVLDAAALECARFGCDARHNVEKDKKSGVIVRQGKPLEDAMPDLYDRFKPAT